MDLAFIGFLKEYGFFPLGGNRRGDLRTAFNLFFVFLLTGVWHGANWTFLLWGIYFGVIIILEKFLLLKFLERIPVFLARLYSFLIVLIGWVLFQAESITAAASTLRLIFSFQYQWDFSLISLTPLTLLSFVVAALLSFARFSFITANRFLNSTTMRTLLIGFLFFNCLLSVAGSTYHPFLYFRF